MFFEDKWECKAKWTFASSLRLDDGTTQVKALSSPTILK
jgi:hypothetical protein